MPGCLTGVVEQLLDPLCQGGQDRTVEQQIQATQQQGADHHRDQDLHSRIHEAFRSAVCQCTTGTEYRCVHFVGYLLIIFFIAVPSFYKILSE